MTNLYTPSKQFDSLVALVETAVAKVDYKGLCDALVKHSISVGYNGKAFNRNFNTTNIKRWCKAESSDGRLQYILAGCGKDSRRGRVTVLAQWDFFCQNSITSQTVLRGLKDNPAIVAGLARMYPKGDSSWGTVEGRLAATLVSETAMPEKAKVNAAKQVQTLETAKQANDRVAFETTSLTIANLIEKYSKPAAKPAAAKPETAKQAKPETAKKAKAA